MKKLLLCIGLCFGTLLGLGASSQTVPQYTLVSSNATVQFYTNTANLILDLSSSGGSTNAGNWIASGTTNANLPGVARVNSILTTNGPVINIKALGAVGDGITDNYAIITNALSMAFLSPSNTVYFPPGMYFSSKAITVPIPATGDSTFTPGIILRGDGINRTRLYFPGSAGLIYKGAAGGGWSAGVIMDMNIEGAVTNNAIGINAADIKAFNLERVMVGYWGKAGVYLTNVWESQIDKCRFYPAGDASSGPITMDNTYECAITDTKIVGGGTTMRGLVVADRFVSTVIRGGDFVGNGIAPHFALQTVTTVTNLDAADYFEVDGTSLENPGTNYVYGGTAHSGNGLGGNGWSIKNLVFNAVNGTLSTATGVTQCVYLTNVLSVKFFSCGFDANPATTNEYGFWDSKVMAVLPGAGNLSGATNLTYIQTNGVVDTSANRNFFWEYTKASGGNPVPTSFGYPNDAAGTVSIGPVTANVWNTNTLNAYLAIDSLGNQSKQGNPFRPVYGIAFSDGSFLRAFNGYATNVAGSIGINYYTNNVFLSFDGYDGNAGNYVIGGAGTNTLGSTATRTNYVRVYESGTVSIGKNNNANWNTQGPGFLEVQGAAFIGGFDGTSIPGNGIYSKGDHKFAANKGLQLKTGVNGRVGTGTLSAGTATVSNTGVTANSVVYVVPTSVSPVSGVLGVTTITAATSFVVTSSNNGDTNTFRYIVFETY